VSQQPLAKGGETAPLFLDRENPAAGLTLPGHAGRVVYAVAVAFSAWQVYAAAFSPLSSQVMRAVHVGFLLLLVFLLFGYRRDQPRGRSSAGPASCSLSIIGSSKPI
jgi:TRAP-type uncharacterized transport system fused permease subunit